MPPEGDPAKPLKYTEPAIGRCRTFILLRSIRIRRFQVRFFLACAMQLLQLVAGETALK